MPRMGESPELAPVFVRVEGVVKRYGQQTALAGLSLDIRRGEALCLLGANGAGKTTLLHALAGLLAPDAGRLRIDGLGDPFDVQVRRSIGLAPQMLALYAQLTVAENLRFCARVFGVSEAELQARVRFGLELADLTRRADQRAGTLSGGMQRRLNLACALLHRPQLLLLDEPTTGVDAQSRGHIFAVIERLKADGLTVVCSTHLMDEADRLADRIAVIDRGQLRALGTRAHLLQAHAHADLQALLLAIGGTEDEP